MTAPQPRRRVAKSHQQGVTLGCCCFAAAAAAAGVATAAFGVPSHRVVPNDAPRRRVEKRRRLEREYFRLLASSQKPQDNSGGTGAAASMFRGVDRRSRRLPASIHKKGREYDQQSAAAVHKKGNNKDEDKEEPLEFALMGGSSSSSINNNVSGDKSPNNAPTMGAPNDAPPTPPSAKNKDKAGDGPDPSARLATNLRSFTRIGGSGYTLPPENRHPYMASLQLEGHTGPDATFDVHMCGGFLVAPDLVMTAAHCARYSPPGTDETFRAFNGIEVGKTDLTDEGVPFDPLSLDTYRLYYENLVPDELLTHPDYNEDTYEHDVMLVKVFGKSRFPPLRVGEGDANLDRVTVLGWGAKRASSQKKYSDRLHSAQMDLMTRRECRDIDVVVRDPITEQSSTLSLREHVYGDMMCASSVDRYMCYGDAGGPAIYRGENSDEDVAYGILSWGYGCVNRDYPAVMAKISDHYTWIREMVCDHSSDPPEWYDCPSTITALSAGGPKQTVTLKLKLDMMAVETGFVIEVADTREIIAQRQTGYYKAEGNEIVLERMELPRNECYRLIMLDSFGDGNCCDMGGGPAMLYKGTDVSYYDGELLTQVNGNFEFDNSGEFCLDRSPANTISVVESDNSEPSSDNNSQPPPTPKRTPRPTRTPTPKPTPRPVNVPNNNSNNGSNSGHAGDSDGGSNHDGSAGWSGPVTNPEFDYCNRFCSSSSHGMLCGNYECIHIAGNADGVATDDSSRGGDSGGGGGGDVVEGEVVVEEEEPPEEVPLVLTSTEFYDDGSEYFLTVQVRFDDNPEEISWVLYDLTVNEVKVFVDFDVYTKEEHANQILNIKVSMDGPEEGEKQYAFTVYDKASNGLCCDHGEGYYKVYLGSEEDDLELLGDAVFEFSSSYYFTLFEGEQADNMINNNAALVTSPPTLTPSAEPTPRPTRRPTKFPTRWPTRLPTEFPTRYPTTSSSRPTTPRPTNIWEKRRSEDVDAIGARWNMRTNTPPGVFNDIGGDQAKYRFHADQLGNAAVPRHSSMPRSVVMGMALVCSFLLLR